MARNRVCRFACTETDQCKTNNGPQALLHIENRIRKVIVRRYLQDLDIHILRSATVRPQRFDVS